VENATYFINGMEKGGNNVMENLITIRRPDDWHLHVRDGEILSAVLPFTTRQFSRAIIMPNLVPPVTTPMAAQAYRERILAAIPSGGAFQPLMTCYLTDDSDPDLLAAGHAEHIFIAAKLYPAHATTNSQLGVTDLARIYPVLERMQRIGMPLLVHGEVTDPDIDIFDREQVFLDRVLVPLLKRFPGLKVVFEHITTAESAQFVSEYGEGRLAATITPHHLVINRNDLFVGGIRPHLYCLPVAKREEDRLALRKAACSGQTCFFLGTDSAPHLVGAKERECGSAGIFNAPIALPCYATVFEEEGALARFEQFASLNGPRFYGLAPNKETLTLRRRPFVVDEEVTVKGDTIRVFLERQQLPWTLEVPDTD
jgi:dihydroorotase